MKPRSTTRRKLRCLARTRKCPEPQSLASQQDQEAADIDHLQIFIVAQRVGIQNEKTARFLTHEVDVCFLKFETSFGQRERPVPGRSHRARVSFAGAIHAPLRNARFGDRSDTWRHTAAIS